jgi:hypothetical protein
MIHLILKGGESIGKPKRKLPKIYTDHNGIGRKFSIRGLPLS